MAYNFRTYEQAEAFVLTLNLKNFKEWQAYCKSGLKPKDIPKTPDYYYKHTGWINWSVFLGTKNLNTRTKKFITYEQCKMFAKTLNIKTQKEWFKYWKDNDRPIDVPHTPQNYYKDKGWIDWYDFLGTEYLSFEEARNYLKSKNLKTSINYQKYWDKNRPKNLPYNPDIFYRFEGWTNWHNFLSNLKAIKKQRQIDRKDYVTVQRYNFKEAQKQEYINVKYKLPYGKFTIDKKGKLEWLDNPCIHIGQDYFCIPDISLNTYKVVKGNMVLDKVNSNYILNNYKTIIDNGKAKIVKEVEKSYIDFFRKKNKKGKIFVMNNRKNVTKQTKILAMLYGKIIVFVKY